MSQENEASINIWLMVGVILIIYGVIITGSGIYFSVTEIPKTVMGESNPSLWWGFVILISGILLSLAGKKSTQN